MNKLVEEGAMNKLLQKSAEAAAQRAQVLSALFRHQSVRSLVQLVRAPKVPAPPAANQPEEIRQEKVRRMEREEAAAKNEAQLNDRAVEVVERIKKKLVGRDFKESDTLKVQEQVDKLIKQASSVENIAQLYIGWCPYW
jgi:phosphatidylinositol kinase/protein kinase (PI-3  family)